MPGLWEQLSMGNSNSNGNSGNQSNSSFSHAFLPGLILGLIVGSVAGAFLPDFLGGSKMPEIKATGAGHADHDGDHEERGREPEYDEETQKIIDDAMNESHDAADEATDVIDDASESVPSDG
jgi:hypothetical protein